MKRIIVAKPFTIADQEFDVVLNSGIINPAYSEERTPTVKIATAIIFRMKIFKGK